MKQINNKKMEFGWVRFCFPRRCPLLSSIGICDTLLVYYTDGWPRSLPHCDSKQKTREYGDFVMKNAAVYSGVIL